MSTSRRLAVVILHYGDPRMTAKLHHQLLGSDPEYGDQILVLDNHAPLVYPDAWRRLPKNIFWAGALQYCLEKCERDGFTHLWFLNNDMSFVSNSPFVRRSWERLVYLEKRGHHVGLYSPCFTSNPYHPQMIRTSKEGFTKVAYLDGIAPLINLDCWRDIGGLDYADNEVGYGVDVWLSLRASQEGWAVVVDQGVVAKHRYHGTARNVDGLMARAAMLEHAYLSARLGDDFRAQIKKFSRYHLAVL